MTVGAEVGPIEVQTGHPYADLVRVLLILVLGGATTMVSLYVMFVYARVYYIDRKLAKIAGKDNWRGLLPRHVTLIASSYLILTVTSIVVGFGRLGTPITWRPFVFGIAYALGLWALWDILGHEKAKMVDPPSAHAPESTRP